MSVDDEFAAEMGLVGVKPLHGKPGPGRKSPLGADVPPARPAASGPGAALRAPAVRGVAPTGTSAPALPSGGKAPPGPAESGALDALRGQLSAAQDALAGAHEALAETQRRAEASLSAAERRLADAEQRAADAERRYEEAHRERRALAQARDTSAGARTAPPRDALEALDLSPAQRARLLALAVELDPAGLVDALETADTLSRWLDTHVARVCDAPECRPRAPVRRFAVEKPKCQVCGGSDVQRAWREVHAAATQAGYKSVAFVGGSPAYHEQLNKLASGSPGLRVRLVDGTVRHTRKDAQGVQNADLVVVWCATELNHATTAPYSHASTSVEHINHRGISGMLRELAARLRP